jgi:5-methylcytosine-specific restriction endonuclease McrA
MATHSHNANGHRRRQLRARVLAEETHCILGGELVDKTLTFLPGTHGPKCRGGQCTGCVPHPRRAEVDEDIPRSRGGSPYERSNCHLICREHNRYKGAMTLEEARLKLAGPRNTEAKRTTTTLVAW